MPAHPPTHLTNDHAARAAKPTCPYAEGTDSLKMHHLWMDRESAVAMDKEIEARRGPVCGKPLHPGSRMCQEHVALSFGYRTPVLPYPVVDGAKPPFTCQHSPTYSDWSGGENRWIAHDINGSFAGEFRSEEDAKRTIDAWNTKGGERVTTTWTAPHDDAPESDRGAYMVFLAGTNIRLMACSQDHSGEIQKALRNALIKYGFETVSEILFAGQTSLTRFGWDGTKPA